MLNNRTTFMERLNDRVTAIETLLQKLEPIEGLLERLTLLEENIYTTKNVLTFMEACVYLGISESLLYKLTSSKEIPHYKPRGKMLYFDKTELDAWLKQNNVLHWEISLVMKAVAWDAKKLMLHQKKNRRRTSVCLILRGYATPNETSSKENSYMIINEELQNVRLSQILKDALIKATDTYSTPPQIIWIDNSTIATLGNFSASTGKAKAKKTFNVSALVAASLANGQVLNYHASLPEGKRRILYVDTEQSRYHCHNVLERILKLAGLSTATDNENLDFICLREYTPAVRIEVIDYALSHNEGYGLVIIDGIRDLLLDINNAAESVEVINKMMEWSSKYNIHIHCVLHLNKGDNNVRGHIGTEMNNKAETVLVISKNTNNPNISEVKALHIREKEFNPFAFTVNEQGLPELATDYDSSEDEHSKTVPLKYTDLTIEQHEEALASAFAGKPIKGFEKTIQAMIPAYEAIGFKRGRSVMVKVLQYLMNDLKLVKRYDKMFYYGEIPTNVQLFEEDE